MLKEKVYINPPKECDVCHKPIGEEMYDAKTIYGPWANMCVNCFNTIGVGLGTGLGQMYKLKDSKYVKEAG